MTKLPKLIDSGIAYEKANLVHRVLQPEGSGPHPTIVMLHGHLGNEDVMWIFKQTVPKDWLMVAPRAIVQDAPNRYSWHPREQGEWPTIAKFEDAVKRVTTFIETLPELYNADLNQLYLMGFSQGAATAFATAVSHPGWVKGIASLVGFMPLAVDDAIDDVVLQDVPVFMAVGTRDDRVPVEVARECGKAVRAMGAYLEYREFETGHKLNGEGMRKLKQWWTEQAEHFS